MKYTDKNRHDDFKWFIEHYDDFFQKYGCCYIAIQNKTILGIYNNRTQAIDSTLKNTPIGTFIVQFCNGDESGYSVYIN